MAHSDIVKGKVEALMKEKGVKASDLIRRMGVSTSTYYDMWSNGYVTLDRLVAMAEVLGVPAGQLLPDEHRSEVISTVSEPSAPYGKPKYLEDRVAFLESEVRKLKEKARPR